MCHQRPHGTGYKHAQIWYLILGQFILREMGSAQYILRFLPFVPIWVALPALPAMGLLGQRWGRSRCNNLWGEFVTPHQKTSAPASLRPHPFPGCCTSGTLTWRRRATSWYPLLPATILWSEGGGTNYLGSIPWSCAQQLHFGGERQPWKR